MPTCGYCGKDVQSLGFASHRARCRDRANGWLKRTARELRQSVCKCYQTQDGYLHRYQLVPDEKNPGYGKWRWVSTSGLVRTDAQLSKRVLREVWE